MPIGYCERKLPPYVKAFTNSIASTIQNAIVASATQTAP